MPTQLGWHFWPEWSSVMGLRLDYLSSTLYFLSSQKRAIMVAYDMGVNEMKKK